MLAALVVHVALHFTYVVTRASHCNVPGGGNVTARLVRAVWVCRRCIWLIGVDGDEPCQRSSRSPRLNPAGEDAPEVTFSSVVGYPKQKSTDEDHYIGEEAQQ